MIPQFALRAHRTGDSLSYNLQSMCAAAEKYMNHCQILLVYYWFGRTWNNPTVPQRQRMEIVQILFLWGHGQLTRFIMVSCEISFRGATSLGLMRGGSSGQHGSHQMPPAKPFGRTLRRLCVCESFPKWWTPSWWKQQDAC